MSCVTRKQSEKEEAIKILRKYLPAGSEVYTILKHVSRSGMSRDISCVMTTESLTYKGKQIINNLDYYISKALDWPLNDKGIRVGGCGMDMGFHLIYSLSRILYPNGFDCIGDNCPSNDHFNREDNKHHKDGGYALIQKWL